jgi:transposase
MPKCDDLSRSLVAFDQDSTLVAVIEMGDSGWLVGGLVSGVARDPRKKIAVDADRLLGLLERWREEARKAGRRIDRMCVCYEAGRDGFWLARWLRARGIECHVMHPTSLPVSREHRRVKTDSRDLQLLKRSFLGWLRGERDHCSMVAVPTLEEEDGRRPLRERETLTSDTTRLVNRLKSLLVLHGIRGFNVKEKKAAEKLDKLRTADDAALPPLLLDEAKAQIRTIDAARIKRIKEAPEAGLHPMILLVAKVRGVGLPTAEVLVREILSRNLRDRRAVARYGGVTGSPDESGKKRREQGLAKAGNGRVRGALLQLAWRFLVHQPKSELATWFHERIEDGRSVTRKGTRKVMIVALAHKLLLMLWELVTTGKLPAGVRLHSEPRFA